jgi:hypothetical protein
MRIASNRFKLIFYCALFNLLFEYSARGVKQFIHRPLFMLALFGIYVTYFAMLEDLIVRFKLTNYQVFLAAFLYGLFPIAFLTGNLFNRNIYGGIIIAGVNVGTVIVVGILAWGVVQGMVTLYLANRLSPRDWDHPRMGGTGWALAIGYQLVVMFVARFNPQTPRGDLTGYLVLGMLVVGTAILLFKSVRSSRPPVRPFRPSSVMDFLAFGSVILFLLLGTLFAFGPTIVTSQPLNVLAVTLENIWVVFCGIVFFVYRFWKGSDVTV